MVLGHDDVVKMIVGKVDDVDGVVVAWPSSTPKVLLY